MRRIRYSVAMSLDGFLAGPQGEIDWIVMDPEIDFGGIFTEFDTVLVGRKTYEATRQQGGGGGMPGLKTVVFSRDHSRAAGRRSPLVAASGRASGTSIDQTPGVPEDRNDDARVRGDVRRSQQRRMTSWRCRGQRLGT